MTDYAELKRLAEAAPEGPWFGPEYAPGTSYVFDVDLGTLLEYQSIDSERDACLRYVAAVNPAAVLALIAENDRLRASDQEATELCDTLSALLGQIAVAVRGPEEPKSRHGFHDLPSRVKTVVAEREQLKTCLKTANEQAEHFERNWYLRGDEIDQLRAEVAGLKTGYEAYERVNAELKAENEALRKELPGIRPFKPYQDSPVIGFTGCVICGVYTDHGGLPCPKTRATADAALGQGEQS